MASSSSSLRVASLSGPPPTPTSLLGLPEPWLLKLETCKGLDGEHAALLALFRTCTFFRDAVARRRTASASFNVPIAAERFPAEVERLSAVARRSSIVRLQFYGETCHYHLDWTDFEADITHLLVCAMAQLEGEEPLACVKEIKLEGMEQSSVVPEWVDVLCPSTTKLDLGWNTEIVVCPLHQPMPYPHLQHLSWEGNHDSAHVADHVRQQLEALPSLTSLSLRNLSWAQQQDEQQSRRLISSTVTRLELTGVDPLQGALQHLHAQFPCLRELDASRYGVVDDAALEQLLSLPHLERMSVQGFTLERSHTQHETCAWRSLMVRQLDVGSFARLPLDCIQACSGWGLVLPSADAAAVAQVAQAVSRWGGVGSAGAALQINGEDVEALLTTLGPLLAVLPVEERRQVSIHSIKEATAQQLQQLGQHLPAGITTLHLHCTAAPDAWAALLPSLPPSVEELTLWDHGLTDQHMLALCQAAVRPIRVVVVWHSQVCPWLSELNLERVRALLVGPEQQPSLVTLVGHSV